jgi:hypothetical protein
MLWKIRGERVIDNTRRLRLSVERRRLRQRAVDINETERIE